MVTTSDAAERALRGRETHHSMRNRELLGGWGRLVATRRDAELQPIASQRASVHNVSQGDAACFICTTNAKIFIEVVRASAWLSANAGHLFGGGFWSKGEKKQVVKVRFCSVCTVA